jgi:hypothetical protein
MFRFNSKTGKNIFLLLCFAFIFSKASTCFAAAGDTLINFSYWNWNEKLTLSNATTEVETPANIATLGVQFERILSKGTSGGKYSVTGLFGQGSGGQTSGTPTYFASFQPTYGLMAETSYFSRVGKRIYLEGGVFLLYRSLKWPTANDVSGSSGASLNYGGIGNLRIRLSKNIDYCQSLGFLLVKANTIWSVGLGYRF